MQELPAIAVLLSSFQAVRLHVAVGRLFLVRFTGGGIIMADNSEDRLKKMDDAGKRMQKFGMNMMGCGCALAIAIPLLILIVVLIVSMF